MADDKNRLYVDLKNPDDPRKTFRVHLRRFTPQNFEEWQEREQDIADAMSKALEWFTEENAPDDPDGRRAYLREVKRTAARHRIIATFEQLQWVIDPAGLKEPFRTWINTPVVESDDVEEDVQDDSADVEYGSDVEVPTENATATLPRISERWITMGNDMTECERALATFRGSMAGKKSGA